VTPTQAGEALAARARRILAEVEAARGDVDNLRGVVRGRVAIGALLPAGEVDVAGLVVGFRDRYPGVILDLYAGTAAELIDRLRTDQIDVSFLMLDGPAPPGIETEHVSAEEIVVAYPPGKAPVSKSLSAAALRGSNLVTPQEGSATKSAMERFLGGGESEVQVSLESGDPHMLRMLASRGIGPAALPRSLANEPGPEIEVRPLRPRLIVPVVLATREGRYASPAAAAFVAFVREAVSA
jgi:DNA-binding transcriptional LysR family regulator